MLLKDYLYKNQKKFFKSIKLLNIDILKVGDREDLINFLLFFEEESNPSYFLKVSRNIKTNLVLKNEFKIHNYVYLNITNPKINLCKPIFYDSNWEGNGILCLEYKSLDENYVKNFSKSRLSIDKFIFESRINFFKKIILKRRGYLVNTELESWFSKSIHWLSDFDLNYNMEPKKIKINSLVSLTIQFFEELEYKMKKIVYNETLNNSLLKFKELYGNKFIKLKIIHGDYNHFNIFYSGGLITIIDWQDGHLNANPYRDIMYLVLNFILSFSKKKLMDVNIQNIIRDNSILNNLIDKYCGIYAKKKKISLSFLYHIIGLTSIEMRFNDARLTEHAKKTCPLYYDNILSTFSSFFIMKSEI